MKNGIPLTFKMAELSEVSYEAADDLKFVGLLNQVRVGELDKKK